MTTHGLPPAPASDPWSWRILPVASVSGLAEAGLAAAEAAGGSGRLTSI